MTDWTVFPVAVLVRISDSVWNGSNLPDAWKYGMVGRKEGRKDVVASQLIRADAGVTAPDNGLFFTRRFSDTHTLRNTQRAQH